MKIERLGQVGTCTECGERVSRSSVYAEVCDSCLSDFEGALNFDHNELSNLEEELSGVREDVTKLERERDDLLDDKQDLENEIADLRKEMDSQADMIHRLRETLEQAGIDPPEGAC